MSFHHFTLLIFCSGAPDGEAICGNPVLRGITPLRCADHDPKSPKLIIDALKNVGIDREIQMKRKLSIYGGKTAPSDMSLK
jgi:hypothetical protein